MKLNLEIIYDNLKNRYSVRRYGSEPRLFQLPRPTLYEAGNELLSDRFYVARVEVLPQKLPKGTHLICIGERLPVGLQRSESNLLLVTGATVARVFNEVQNIFDRFDCWEQEMQALLLAQEPDVAAMVSIGMSLLDKHFSFMTPSLELFFTTHSYSEGNVEVNISATSLTLDQMLGMKEVCTQERMIRTPFISGMSVDGRRNYCYNLYLSNCFIGCATVQEKSQSFRESDFALIDFFFTYFERIYLRYIYREEAQPAAISALQNLIQHIPLTDHEYQSLSLQPEEKWIAFRLTENHQGKVMPRDYMRTTLNIMLRDIAYAIILGDRILGIIRIPASDSTDETAPSLTALKELIDNMGYRCGLSQSFDDLKNLSYHLRQAQYASEMLQYSISDAVIAHFRDYFLEYLLQSAVAEMPAAFFCSPGFVRLRKYDAERNTELVKTLDYYLLHETNGAKTAQALFIHRSSLQKRLDKIMELTGEDFEDPNVRLYYRILFRLQSLD